MAKYSYSPQFSLAQSQTKLWTEVKYSVRPQLNYADDDYCPQFNYVDDNNF